MTDTCTTPVTGWMAPADMPSGALIDEQVRELCTGARQMIQPFHDRQYRTHANGAKMLSYGLSSTGYDFRLNNTFLAPYIAHDQHAPPLDLKTYHPQDYFSRTKVEFGETFTLPPNSFVLGCTMECVDMPDDVKISLTGKSTCARMGLSVYITPVECGFYGTITLEIHNACPFPVLLYPGEGIAQGEFTKTAMRPMVTYRDRKGKYQNIQTGWPVPPML